MPTETRLKRPLFATFLKVNNAFQRVGKGVTDLSVEYNPNITTEQYIHEDSATHALENYDVSVPINISAFSGEPIFDYLDGLRKNRAVGSSAEGECLLVNIYEETNNAYFAEKSACTIAIESFGGAGGETNVLSATIYLNGDPVQGTATISNGVATFAA